MRKRKSIGNIEIKGARVHNLKNISVDIPRNQFVVVTGVSGSGKSSLAFDTLYAEGQRRYVESLSSYARQFLGRIDKPEVDYIYGIPPAIAIEQKVNIQNNRSTVGTSTEVYDFLRILFARLGRTYSPISGEEVKCSSVEDVVNFIVSFPEKTKMMLLAPKKLIEGREFGEEMSSLRQQGFSRIRVDEKLVSLSSLEEDATIDGDRYDIVVDRLSVSHDDESRYRYADSVQTTFYEGEGECQVIVFDPSGSQEQFFFSNRFERDGMIFEVPSPEMFTFNSPTGACEMCEGYGKVLGIDPDLVIPNKSLSVYEDAVACWRGEKMSEWKNQLLLNAHKFDFPVHAPYVDLTEEQKRLLWTGNQHFEGIDAFFKMVEEQVYKVQYRVMLSRYRGKTTCPSCNGFRLKANSRYVQIGGHSIQEFLDKPVYELVPHFAKIKFDEYEVKVAKRVIGEIAKRLELIDKVGLGYLTLNRLSSTLSGGESQRLNLVTSLGSSLVGSLYILDEPSIGLHSKDTERLVSVLNELRDLGNTVLVVEHDEDIMKAADQIIDIGPRAGMHGGEVVFQGNMDQLLAEGNTLTSQYLSGVKKLDVPQSRRPVRNYITVHGANENNLNHVTAKFPLNMLTVVTGVSGSGKSTLVKNTLWPFLAKYLGGYGNPTGAHDYVDGDLSTIHAVEFVDQNPIGKSSRSNAVTYLKIYDDIRALFASQKQAKVMGMKANFFSFNSEGGRCEQCNGEGVTTVEMQFMADVRLKCDLCDGKRFKPEVLEVKYRKKSIYDVLTLTVNQAVAFFSEKIDRYEKSIVKKLKTLQDVGLGYIQLGQSSSTLSGGESQRVKLASFLAKEKTVPTMFIFDEPTTGLHFDDIALLMKSLQSLIERGHTVIIIEHNLDVIKTADWIIDLGPGGGKRGGNIIFEGTPEALIQCADSVTAPYLKDKLL
ncbi:excinuclease ABC subunit UvrA [Halosquirtibacter laminarini]|uniref:Excinuclease ABC subunit UvrA n=1 Tax=Halosquirtibacter laminarini TaxID=3374600 RepID=A0AC61NI56_9BACT|nr:excinuclease ABC subunit UvrA [Prolixibacteraceae bacterium]